MQVDDPLVDSHLEAVPRLGALTARGLPRGDSEGMKNMEYHTTISMLRKLVTQATHCFH